MKARFFLVVLCVCTLLALWVPTAWGDCRAESVECSGDYANATTYLGNVTILMYHNLLPAGSKSGKYCITTTQLDKDFRYLKDNGYSVIRFDYLLRLVEERIQLPDKAVLITFDDGHLSNVRLGLPLLQKYGYSALLSVVGEFTAYGKSNPKIAKGQEYLEWSDIGEYANNPNIEWGLHSYDMHRLKGRKGVKILCGEDSEKYKETFRQDTEKLMREFNKVGISPIVYAYPYGLFCKESEEVLKQLNVPISLTCGERSCTIKSGREPRLLGRFNRSGLVDSLAEVLPKD
ncbi:MAG: polysaccharide deacetylase family protein [Christensenellales bacterium]